MRTLLFVLLALAIVFTAHISAKACDGTCGVGGVVPPVAAQFFAPSYSAVYAPRVLAAPVYAAPAAVVVQRQAAVYAAPAVVAAPVVKQRVVVRQRTFLRPFRGVRVNAGRAAVAVGY